jgi:transcriptional regulator with XRE-family HTH domain
MVKREPISDQLRKVILNADKSRYRIAQETGLSEAALSRFVNGVCGLSLDSIDKVGECLGLEITTGKRKPRKSKGR